MRQTLTRRSGGLDSGFLVYRQKMFIIICLYLVVMETDNPLSQDDYDIIKFSEFIDHHIDDELKAIYLIEVGGKGYVGQSNNTQKRFTAHRSEKSGCVYIRNALRKYGIQDATIRILERELSQDDANMMEAFYIEILGTLAPKGYNLTIGGDSQIWSPEKLEVFRSPEMREHRSKLSTDMWKDPQHRDKIKIVFSSYDYIEALRNRMIQLWQNNDFRDKQTATRATDDFRKGQSDGAKRQWSDPEKRQMITNSIIHSRGRIITNFKIERGVKMGEFIRVYNKYNGIRKSILEELGISITEYKRRRRQMEAMYFM
ncbi:GIY-YIG catalytic domain-containing endonuclease [Paramecium bursaria Chlorella virus NW665.2]|nr:GIY-YIG catalytic domain-containing endonuclease [Paramecium bursaria Chlorella virus NW665.2]